MGDLWSDVKHAFHMFYKNPGFTIAAVAALVLGIGANSATFTLVNAVLLKPLSYSNPDRIVEFLLNPGESVIASNLASIPEFHLYQLQTSRFNEVAAYDTGGPSFNVTSDRPEQIHGLHVTEGYFRLFGAPLILGRTFTPQEDSLHGGKVAVLSYGLWQRKFGGDTTIMGKSLSLGNEPHTIVGVIESSFTWTRKQISGCRFNLSPLATTWNHSFQVAGLLKLGSGWRKPTPR